MKKSSLQDMKKKNRRLVLQTVMEQESLSRIEISQISGLSPSTVSSLVSELLDEEVLVETGEAASTGGRKRIGLSINENYASIAVVEVKRSGAVIRMFDMQLCEQDSKTLSDKYISGNELLVAITAAVFEFKSKEYLKKGKLAGIGLLFQEDMTESEFNVMYSTSLSSAAISLKDALTTQFHIPVVEDYTQSYSMAHLTDTDMVAASRNSAFVHIGQRVLASITVDGKQVDLKGKKVIDITPLVVSEKAQWPLLTDKNMQKNQPKHPSLIKGLWDSYTAVSTMMAAAVQQLTNALKPMCIFFQIDTIFLAGAISKLPGFTEAAQKALNKQMAPFRAPKLQAAEEKADDLADDLAGRIRQSVLCAN